MLATFKEIRKLQGERVRMKFDDGREIVATLLCATKDMDGSRHLVYNKVESGSPGDLESPAEASVHADAKALLQIEAADPAGPPLSRREPLPPQGMRDNSAWKHLRQGA